MCVNPLGFRDSGERRVTHPPKFDTQSRHTVALPQEVLSTHAGHRSLIGHRRRRWCYILSNAAMLCIGQTTRDRVSGLSVRKDFESRDSRSWLAPPHHSTSEWLSDGSGPVWCLVLSRDSGWSVEVLLFSGIVVIFRNLRIFCFIH